MKSFRAHLSLKEDATPRFHRPRPVPFAIKDSVGRELDRLEEAGILRKIDHSEWAAPVVPVRRLQSHHKPCITGGPVPPPKPNRTNDKPYWWWKAVHQTRSHLSLPVDAAR